MRPDNQEGAGTATAVVRAADAAAAARLRGAVEDAGVAVVGEATTRSRCLELLDNTAPSLLVMAAPQYDVDLELEVISRCRLVTPPVSVVVVAGRRSSAVVRRMLGAGAAAYVVDAGGAELDGALRHAVVHALASATDGGRATGEGLGDSTDRSSSRHAGR